MQTCPPFFCKKNEGDKLSSSKTSKYGFIPYPLIWGWATWRRSWDGYSFNLEDFNKKEFQKLGDQGLLALIGDSTNANIPGYSGSEKEVMEEFINVFSRYNKRIVVTCFSSNIARMKNIIHAAKKNNRKIALIGRSMKKNIEAAFKNNFIKDIDIFISEEEASLIPRENLLVICTGSQGEKRSALYRIAYKVLYKPKKGYLFVPFAVNEYQSFPNYR